MSFFIVFISGKNVSDSVCENIIIFFVNRRVDILYFSKNHKETIHSTEENNSKERRSLEFFKVVYKDRDLIYICSLFFNKE